MDETLKGAPIFLKPLPKGVVVVVLSDANTSIVALQEGPTRFRNPDPTRELHDLVEEREHGFLEVINREPLRCVVDEEINGSDVVQLHEQVHVAEVVRAVLVASRGCWYNC